MIDYTGSVETIRIGEFRLTKYTKTPDKVWIEICGDGEGGEFKESALESVIANFYAINF